MEGGVFEIIILKIMQVLFHLNVCLILFLSQFSRKKGMASAIDSIPPSFFHFLFVFVSFYACRQSCLWVIHHSINHQWENNTCTTYRFALCVTVNTFIIIVTSNRIVPKFHLKGNTVQNQWPIYQTITFSLSSAFPFGLLLPKTMQGWW